MGGGEGKARRWFASDNNASAHPEMIAAIADANAGHAIGYGDDRWTKAASERFKAEFGSRAETFFVFNGTGANVFSAALATRPFEAAFCPESAHLNVDETGAPERIVGVKVVPVRSDDGKLSIHALEARLKPFGEIHHNRPKLVSISQPTELGTLYSIEELRQLCRFAHERGLVVHVDGARISNAAVALGASFGDMIASTGVDLLSFGGTKNGLVFGEAVVVLNPELLDGAAFVRKNVGQLASKMRFIAAQYERYLATGLWERNAKAANDSARELGGVIGAIDGVELAQRVETNAVFAMASPEAAEEVRSEQFFYTWDEERHVYRWMTSWDTERSDIEHFGELLSRAAARHPRP
jgi:threonine aldolase